MYTYLLHLPLGKFWCQQIHVGPYKLLKGVLTSKNSPHAIPVQQSSGKDERNLS